MSINLAESELSEESNKNYFHCTLTTQCTPTTSPYPSPCIPSACSSHCPCHVTCYETGWLFQKFYTILIQYLPFREVEDVEENVAEGPRPSSAFSVFLILYVPDFFILPFLHPYGMVHIYSGFSFFLSRLDLDEFYLCEKYTQMFQIFQIPLGVVWKYSSWEVRI